MVKLVLDTILSNSVDLHLGQATSLSLSDPMTITSKNSSHFEHLNSYMGMFSPGKLYVHKKRHYMSGQDFLQVPVAPKIGDGFLSILSFELYCIIFCYYM